MNYLRPEIPVHIVSRVSPIRILQFSITNPHLEPGCVVAARIKVPYQISYNELDDIDRKRYENFQDELGLYESEQTVRRTNSKAHQEQLKDMMDSEIERNIRTVQNQMGELLTRYETKILEETLTEVDWYPKDGELQWNGRLDGHSDVIPLRQMTKVSDGSQMPKVRTGEQYEIPQVRYTGINLFDVIRGLYSHDDGATVVVLTQRTLADNAEVFLTNSAHTRLYTVQLNHLLGQVPSGKKQLNPIHKPLSS